MEAEFVFWRDLESFGRVIRVTSAEQAVRYLEKAVVRNGYDTGVVLVWNGTKLVRYCRVERAVPA